MAADCGLCGREESILSVTGTQLPVGERCYTKLLTKDVVWNPETKLKKLEESLLITPLDHDDEEETGDDSRKKSR